MSTILIVDDIEDNLYLLQALLEGKGHRVEKARNGSEAIVRALEVMPDLVISDILMPVIDGFTLCRIWKSDRRLARAPFIFYTATYTDPRDEKLALDMGADAFIVKPTEPDEFMERIVRVLERTEGETPATPGISGENEETILKTYNEVLVRKLEHKMLNLEKLNRELEEEMEARRQAESSLHASEERYRLIFENSMDAIFLTEPGGAILDANPEACRIFGRTVEEFRLIGRAGIIDGKDPRLREALDVRALTGHFSGELNATRKDGTVFPCEVSSAVFKDRDGKARTATIIRDITQRKKSEERVLTSLREQEALLKEIHHRVKNNMQVISSLVSLQLQSCAAKLSGGKVAEVAQDLHNRIQSMALVHEMLYSSKSLSRIDPGEYVRNLIDQMSGIYGIGAGSVSFRVEVENVPVTISTAIPLGLIINELITNAMKFAFPPGEEGEIVIGMEAGDEGACALTVRDNGVGLPKDFNPDGSSTFGMRLVSILVRQIHGTLEYRNDGGAVFTVRFVQGQGDMKDSLLENPE